MANVHGLFSGDNKKDEDDEDSSNNRYVGGIGARGGGRWVIMDFLFVSCQWWMVHAAKGWQGAFSLVLIDGASISLACGLGMWLSGTIRRGFGSLFWAIRFFPFSDTAAYCVSL